MDINQHNDIFELLHNTWGIAPRKVIQINEGSADCFVIETVSDKYFLKIYQEKFDRESLKNEVALCGFLLEKGFSVSHFLRSLNGMYVEIYDNRFCILQKYIYGITFHKFEVSKSELIDSVKVLAKLNIALEELPFQLPVGFTPEWYTEWSVDCEIEKYKKLLAKLDVNDIYYNRIAADFKAKSRLIERFNPTEFDFSHLTYANTHGDYNVLQLIFENSKVKSVIDFSSCARLPICWEIIRSYTLSSTECRYGIIDQDNFIAYVQAYMEIKRLTRNDLGLMPYFYLFTLLRSTFGYKTYIEKKNHSICVDSKDLATLEFAFWRTSMCNWLYQNAEHLSLQLISIVE